MDNQDNRNQQNNGRPNQKPNSSKKGWLYTVLLILLILMVVYIVGLSNKIEKITYTEFQDKVVAGEVAELATVGNTAYVLLVDSKIDSKNFPNKADFKFTFINSELLIQFVNDYNEGKLEGQTQAPETKIDASYNVAQQSWFTTLMPYLSFAIILVLGYFLIKSMMGASGRNMGFGKTKAVLGENVKVRFADVAGSEEEKAEMQELVEFLKNPRKFTRLGARIPKGVLLVGPPGTGKTMLAKAIAGESNVPFYSISGSDFVEMFVGVGASRVRDLFDQAKRNAPCLVFIDEIDAVGRQRGAGLGGGNDEREQTLNQLLVQMDGFSGSEGVIVIAATNRPDVLDPALLRAGRFDRQIVVNRPDVSGREKILQVHSKNKPLADDVDFKAIAKITIGFTGADLANVMNEAAILTARDDRSVITMNDINEAIAKVQLGPQKRSVITTDADNKRTAYHEAGHAIVAYVLQKDKKVHEISIIQRGMALGYTQTRNTVDSNSMSYEQLCNEIAMAAGGRCAEELIFGEKSVGASNDIKQMTNIARAMVTEYGMSSKFGMMYLGSESELFLGKDYQSHTSYSEKIAGEIDEEVKRLIKENYDRAVKVLKDNVDKLNVMAHVLLEKETIYSEEVDLIMSGATADEVIAKINEKAEIMRKQEELARQEREKQTEQALMELRERAQRALYEAGVVTEKPQSNVTTAENNSNNVETAENVKNENIDNKPAENDANNNENQQDNVENENKEQNKPASKTKKNNKTNNDKNE